MRISINAHVAMIWPTPASGHSHVHQNSAGWAASVQRTYSVHWGPPATGLAGMCFPRHGQQQQSVGYVVENAGSKRCGGSSIFKYTDSNKLVE